MLQSIFEVIMNVAMFILVPYFIKHLMLALKAKLRPIENFFMGVGSTITLFGLGLWLTPKFWFSVYALQIAFMGIAVFLAPRIWTMLTGWEFLSTRQRESRLKPHNGAS